MQVYFKDNSLNKLADAVRKSGRDFSREFATACNKTARGMRTPINKEIRKELATKAGAVKKTIGISRKATKQTLAAGVEVKRTERIPLRDFGARQTRKGVSYRISKSEGRKKIPEGFIVQKIGGHVFRRKTKQRLPIQKLFGASPYGVFVKQKMEVPISAEAEERLAKEIDRRIQYNIFKANQLT